MPGMSASVSSSIFVMENPSPTFSSFTVAPVWMRFGVMPAREKLRGQRHREAAGVGRADQLFRVGSRLARFKSGLERIWAVQRTAPDFQPPAAFGQITFPFCLCFLCWHTASLAMSKAFTHRGRQTRHRVTAVTPGPEPAGEWPHPLDSTPSEEERHTGARRLVGSRAIEDDLPLARDLVVPILQLLERQLQRARQDGRLGLEVQPGAPLHPP